MTKELDAMETNHTWDIIPLPPGKTPPIGCIWVYKVKHVSDGLVEVTKHL